ncbi:MAG: glycosyltransferase family A protein [Pseudomonadota bacterium]
MLRSATPPAITVVMACRNAADTLLTTIQALQGQTVTDWELLAVDDASTDDTPQILASATLADPRISWRKLSLGGPARARNLGVDLARASLIAFLEPGDICAPDRLALLVQGFATRPLADALYGRLDGRGRVPPDPLGLDALLEDDPVGTVSNLAVRRDAFDAVGGFDSNAARGEALDLLTRMALSGARIHGLDRVMVHRPAAPTATPQATPEATPEATHSSARLAAGPAARPASPCPSWVERLALVGARLAADADAASCSEAFVLEGPTPCAVTLR